MKKINVVTYIILIFYIISVVFAVKAITTLIIINSIVVSSQGYSLAFKQSLFSGTLCTALSFCFLTSGVTLNLYNSKKAVYIKKEKVLYQEKNINRIIHDIRSPISSILGSIQLMESKGVQDSSAKNLYQIKNSSYKVLKLVNQLLDLQKLYSGNMSLDLINCNIEELVLNTLELIKPYAKSKGIDLIYVPGKCLFKTMLDIEKFERIIINLLSNSIKFTQDGGTIKISLRNSSGKIRFYVHDNGPGIDYIHKNLIFNEFYQVGSSYSGSGLGLSIVRDFTKLHNGKVFLKSKVGKGTVFMVSIPLLNSKDASQRVPYNCNDTLSQAVKIELSDLSKPN